MKYPAPTFYLAAIVFVILTTLTAMAVAGDTEQSIANVRQETQVRTFYMLSLFLRNNNLMVSVHNSKAVISGAKGDF